MIKEDLQLLKQCGLEVIKEEGLQLPKDIHFKTGGYKKRAGTCCRKKICGNYVFNIIVYLSIINFVEDVNGKYKDDKGVSYTKSLFPKRLPFKHIMNTLAHEIAHIKFWRHGPQHLSYTNYLLQKIKQKMEV